MLRQDLEKYGHKVFQTNLDTLIPFIHEVKFDEVWEFDEHSDFMPVERTDIIKQALKIIQTTIAEEYLQPNSESVEFLHNTICKGIAKKADQWHSESIESSDVFFLLYFNDMTKSNSGAFLIKDENENITRILPKCGTLIAVENNQPKFLHMVEQTEEIRIVACFNFKVKWNDS